MDLSNILDFIYPYKKLLIAFSGGLDSTVLLHQLMICSSKNSSDIKIRAIHINHGLSPKSNIWSNHCRSLCVKWNIPFLIRYVNIFNNKVNVEEQARKARYSVFKRILLPEEVLVTAHHIDDQSETFMLALKRGSGPAGLSSMSFYKKFGKTYILRPFLNKRRVDLLKWAYKYNLCWIEDESNHKDCYDRNFLRLHVIPLLVKRWPFFTESVSRSAILCAEQESLIDELLSKELTSLMSNNGTLNIDSLKSLSEVHRAALIRRWIAIHGGLMPSKKILKIIWNEVAQARKDANPCLQLNGIEIRRFRDELWWVIKRQSLRDQIINWLDINKSLILPFDAGRVNIAFPGNVRLPLSNEAVSVRFTTTNKILSIAGRSSGKRKLKKIWQECNIPPWMRFSIPLIFYNESLITAVGVFITKEGWINKKNGIKIEWKYS